MRVDGWQQSFSGVDLGVLITRLQYLFDPTALTDGSAVAELDEAVAMGLAARFERIELKGFLPCRASGFFHHSP